MGHFRIFVSESDPEGGVVNHLMGVYDTLQELQ